MIWFASTRAVFAVVTALASSYFTLAAFTAEFLDLGPLELTSGIGVAVRLFPYLVCASVLAVGSTLTAPLRARNGLALQWLAVTSVFGVAAFWPGLAAAPADDRSLTWSLIVTFPAAVLGLLDLTLARPRLKVDETPLQAVGLVPVVAGAVLVAIVFGTRAAAESIAAAPDLTAEILLVAMGATLTDVAAVVAVVFGIALAQALASRGRAHASFAVACVCWWAAAVVVTRRVIAPALSLNNGDADLWAALLPIGFVLLLAGTNVSLRAAEGQAPGSDALAPLRVIRLPRLVAVVSVLAISAAGVSLLPRIAPLDWQGLFQHVVTLAVLLLVVAMASSLGPHRPVRKGHIAALTLGSAVLVVAGVHLSESASRTFGARGSEAASLFSSLDPLTSVRQQILRTPFRDASAEGFFRELRANSMIKAPIRAPKIELGPLSTRPAFRPDIYLIVFDSLRRDAVEPYTEHPNTPAIAAFARESTVFREAFTRFIGTTLSQAAIFAGATPIHRQYPEPFANMNALEKLAIADGYVRIISRDPVTDSLLQRLPGDRVVGSKVKYWSELTAELALRQVTTELEQIPASQPAFVFVQPKDMHSVTLSLRRKADPAFRAKSYLDQYRAAVGDIDRAVGEFLTALKRTGRYERSIVVLTSDHGDGIGHFGRWGHTESVLPDTLRIPLIVHLPREYRGLTADINRLAVTTDIAPSLYYLLGHRPTLKHAFAGRPLFTASEAEQQEYMRPYEVFANSYGPRFGVVDRQTHTLFQADAVTRREGYFDLERDPDALRNLITVEDQRRGEERIRSYLAELNRFYEHSPVLE